MQIDINPDASEYKETIYFGMTIRQCICCVLAIIAAAPRSMISRSCPDTPNASLSVRES